MTPPPVFHDAILKLSRPETLKSRHLEILPLDSDLLATYRTPGQYAQIRFKGQSSYFAFSNTPGEPAWSFLVKESSPLTAELLQLPEKAKLEITPALGNGFNLEAAAGKNVLLFAAGSGIAPIRAAVSTLLKNRPAYAQIALYYGARNPDEFAYERDFKSWTEDGVVIFQTISNRASLVWTGSYGYVQHHLGAAVPSGSTVAYLCGMKVMIEEVRRKLISLGLPQELILTNY